MHVVLICTSVIVQFYSVISYTENADITDGCLRGQTIDFNLSPNAGEHVSSLAKISKQKHLNCSIEFKIKDGYFVIGVIEFPDWNQEKPVCIEERLSSVTVSDFSKTKRCENGESVQRYSIAYKSKIIIYILDLHDGPHIQILGTSMKDPGYYECNDAKEVECVYRDNVYCMVNEVLCDGYENCGVPNAYDENFGICKGLGLTTYMIIYTIIMHLVSVLLIVSFFMTFAPKRKDTFVYKFDQSILHIDTENEVVAYDIDIEILFPNDTKPAKIVK